MKLDPSETVLASNNVGDHEFQIVRRTMASIHWEKAIELYSAKWEDYPDHKNLMDKPGIYFFSRSFGSGDYEPFYIGQSLTVKTRLKQYFNSNGNHEVRIRSVIQGLLDDYSGIQIANGPRYFHFGYVTPVQGQKMERALDFAERALIQYGKIIEWDLINNQHAGPAAFRTFEMSGSNYSHLLPKKLIAHK